MPHLFKTSYNVLRLDQHLRSIGYRAQISLSISFDLLKMSYRFVTSSIGSCFNSTASSALQNPHRAQRHYRARSASECRTAFARAAHRVVCQACPWRRLVMLWLVPGGGRAWLALEILVCSVVHGATVLERRWELSYPSCRNHPLGLRLPRFDLHGLRGELVCTHLGGFGGGFSR
jgi:hypothetical protein